MRVWVTGPRWPRPTARLYNPRKNGRLGASRPRRLAEGHGNWFQLSRTRGLPKAERREDHHPRKASTAAEMWPGRAQTPGSGWAPVLDPPLPSWCSRVGHSAVSPLVPPRHLHMLSELDSQSARIWWVGEHRPASEPWNQNRVWKGKQGSAGWGPRMAGPRLLLKTNRKPLRALNGIKVKVTETVPTDVQSQGFLPGSFPRNPLFCFRFFFFFCRCLFVLFFIYFDWRLIVLQYCSGFAIHWHESAMGVHVFPILSPLPPLSPSHPSGSSQCTSPEHPVSCIKPGLAIYFTYDNTHVPMLFSQIIPSSPSPTESILYICVSFAVLHIGSSLPPF